MKTKSMGSLIKRGATFYAMWRHGGKQFCKALRMNTEHQSPHCRKRKSQKARAHGVVSPKEGQGLKSCKHPQRIDNTKAGKIESHTPGLSIKAALVCLLHA